MKGQSYALWHYPGSDCIEYISGRALPYGESKGLRFTMHEFWPERGDSFDIEALEHGQITASEIAKLDIDGLDSSGLYNAGPDKDAYCKLVSEAIAVIEAGKADKLVVSRYSRISKPAGFRPQQYFLKLCDIYPKAFVALVKHEGFCWICASPEILLEISNNEAHTMALAGTRLQGDSRPFEEKEFAEQQYVRAHIESALRKLEIDYTSSGVTERQAGNLKHLYTLYTMKDPGAGKTEQLQMALHPTPAISGLPVSAALEFLKRHEHYTRTFYGGFLGPVIPGHGRHLYVNLRCMQVFSDSLVLFAGGGINKGSEPEHEWLETENKLATLGGVIGD